MANLLDANYLEGDAPRRQQQDGSSRIDV